MQSVITSQVGISLDIDNPYFISIKLNRNINNRRLVRHMGAYLFKKSRWACLKIMECDYANRWNDMP